MASEPLFTTHDILSFEPWDVSDPGARLVFERGSDRGVASTVLLTHAVPAQRVVVETGVLHERHPVSPAGRYV